MIILLIFALIGGVVTVLSPCILPVLPLILSGTATGSKKRAWGVIVGFIASFSFFTLFLATIVRSLGIPADFLRLLAIVLIGIFGLVMAVPFARSRWEQFASRLLPSMRVNKSDDLIGGVVLGTSIGLVWVPCVGPILASIITLAATAEVGLAAVVIMVAYAVGTSIPLLGIIYGGQRAMAVMPILKNKTESIQQAFGVLMILTAVGFVFNIDRKVQQAVLDWFPGYGAGLTQLEDNSLVDQALNELSNPEEKQLENIGDMIFQDRDYPIASELSGGNNWIGTEPLSLSSLRGKVVLIDFWTYTCINCIRTLPYLTAWDEKYRDDGLVIIGVHSPEFEFEKETDNVIQAMEDFGIEYVVVQDNDFVIWRNYKNRYWPAKYLIDTEGRIRYTHFGEGEYEETEIMIQKLLAERNEVVDKPLVDLQAHKNTAQTPETYLGYWRMDRFRSPEGINKDEEVNYSLLGNLRLNDFGYEGTASINEKLSNMGAGSKLTLRFKAKEVHLVMRSKVDDSKARIILDGEFIGTEAAGRDVDQGVVNIVKDREYQLVSMDEAKDSVLTIEFEDDQVEVYAFTFG